MTAEQREKNDKPETFKFRGSTGLQSGHSLALLNNGDEFFPQLIKRIDAAEREVVLETFILTDKTIGSELKDALIRAAERGVWVCITVDGWGSFYLPQSYIDQLTQSGVVFQIYDPQPNWMKVRPKIFRRLHRKLAIIDATYGFIGGINFCDSHYIDFGDRRKKGKRDFAVEMQGPIVLHMRALCLSYVCREGLVKLPELDVVLPKSNTEKGSAEVSFVERDNRISRNAIENAYIRLINRANHRIAIACAYFFPGVRFMRAMKKARKRGVEIEIVLQGYPESPFALLAARSMYKKITKYGIKIYEYMERPLHGKIAIVDDEWSTIGSSNLDPWSLGLNLEANIVVKDRDFNQDLLECIHELRDLSTPIDHSYVQNRSFVRTVKDLCWYHILRLWPSLLDWIPNPKIRARQIVTRTAIDSILMPANEVDINKERGNDAAPTYSGNHKTELAE